MIRTEYICRGHLRGGWVGEVAVEGPYHHDQAREYFRSQQIEVDSVTSQIRANYAPYEWQYDPDLALVDFIGKSSRRLTYQIYWQEGRACETEGNIYLRGSSLGQSLLSEREAAE